MNGDGAVGEVPTLSLSPFGLGGQRGWLARTRAYLELTRWPELGGLLLATVAGALLGSPSTVSGRALLGLFVGGLLLIGSASAFNQYLDRELDQRLARTQRRPLPSRRLTPAEAGQCSLILGAAGVATLTALVNWKAAGVGITGWIGYVLVYTYGLKRSPLGNLVSRALLVPIPFLVGWVGVNGPLASLTPWLVSFWLVLLSPAQTWPLVLRTAADYRAAGLHLLPMQLRPPVARLVVLLSLVPTVILGSNLGLAVGQPIETRVAGVAFGIGLLAIGTKFWLSGSPGDARRLELAAMIYAAGLLWSLAIAHYSGI
jgi:protoheme IX farnesyltransferase